ncbi:MAG: hypothetical protein HY717_19085 [Planctomycetes bacterium]|nr:hypothetical protein [Planctomycetota bacterium]
MAGWVVLTGVNSLLSGCAAPEEGPPPWTRPEQFDAGFREWSRVYHLDVLGGQRIKKQVGYFYHQFSQNRGDDLYWVLDLKQKPVGFLVQDFNAYRFAESRDADGKKVVDTQVLGNRGLVAGVQRILGLNSGTVKLEKEVEQGEAPQQVVESAPGTE